MSDNDLMIELDETPAERKRLAEQGASIRPLELDAKLCRTCSAERPLNDDSVCRACFDAQGSLTSDAATLGDALSIIAGGAKAASERLELNSVARGRASMGVGFNSAEGYIEAMRRGVRPATLDEYARTLRDTYKYRVDETTRDATHYSLLLTKDGKSETVFAAFLADAETPQEQTAQQKANAEHNANAMKQIKANAAKQRAAAQAKTTELVTPPKAEEKVASIALTSGQLVAGAIAEGHGITFGWTGKGDKTHAEMTEIVTLAGLPAAWMPDVKEPGVQLSRAVKAAAAGEFNCEQEKASDVQVVEERKHASRWMLVRRALDGRATVGAKFGDIALVVTLYTDSPIPELVFDDNGDVELQDKVRAEFNARIGSQRYVAADITKWLQRTIKERLGGAKLGSNWYVPRAHRATAERIVSTLDGKWGSDWNNPPLPIASCAQLAAGLARSLREDVDDVLSKLEAQRKVARDAGREDVGEKAAGTFELRFIEIMRRIAAYGELLGEQHVASCRARVKQAQLELTNIIEVVDLDLYDVAEASSNGSTTAFVRTDID